MLNVRRGIHVHQYYHLLRDGVLHFHDVLHDDVTLRDAYALMYDVEYDGLELSQHEV